MVMKMKITKQEAFANKLKQLRLASQISQTSLAKNINVSRSCLANYESGKRFPSADILDIISNYFKVSVDYLLTPQSSVWLEKDYNSDVTQLIKDVSAKGKLDISNISPLSKIALFEFYNFLKYQEKKPRTLGQA